MFDLKFGVKNPYVVSSKLITHYMNTFDSR